MVGYFGNLNLMISDAVGQPCWPTLTTVSK